MENKEKKLIFEGADKSGKSTLVKILRQEYPNLDIADRSFISDRVFAKMFKRDRYLGVDITTYLNYWEQFHANMLDTRIVLVTCNLEQLAQRCMQAEEPFCRNRTFEQVKDYVRQEQIEFCNATQAIRLLYDFKTLELNTNYESINESIKRVREFITYDGWVN